ncbi:MAG: hypothetical protein JHC95_21850 [Solirubrobacteraceae bacterium]|nr:hypothetical protein [Solirubrobacteraceae bacterium]
MLLAVVATFAFAVPATPAPAAAKPVECAHYAYYPTLMVSSARGLKCRTAVRDIKRYKGKLTETFRTPGGFACELVDGDRAEGQWRCVKADRAYRFEYDRDA